MNVSRRRVIGSLVVMALGQFVPRLALADTGRPVEAASGFDAFLRLSRFITQVEHLDQATGEEIYGHILREPWGREHLRQIDDKWREFQSINQADVTLEQLLETKHFESESAKGELWFINHLLTTWFTGIYYHQSGNHVVTYRNALMHVALQGVRPIPGYCLGSFGYWAEPPEGIA